LRRRSACIAAAAALIPLSLGGCGGASSGGDAGSLPLVTVEDLPLPGGASRFDYQSYDPENHLLFIAHLGDGALTVVDTQSREVVERIEGIAEAHGVDAVPSLGQAFVSATGTNELVAVDEQSGRIVFRAATGDYPDGVAYNPPTGRVFVSDKVGGTETVIDARSGKRIGTVDLGGEVGNVKYDSGSGDMLANAQGLGQLVSIDPDTLRIDDRVDLEGCEGNHGLLVDAQHRLAFVACEGNAQLVTVDLSTLEVVSTEPVGDVPDVLAFDPSLGRLYVASESGVVSVFEERDSSLAKLGEETLAASAHTVAVDPVTHLVYFPLEDVDGEPVLRITKPE